MSEISKELKVELTGLFSEYSKELSLSGFIRRDYTWNIKTGKDSKLSKYRLSDNYLRLKFNTLYVCEIKFSKNAIGMDVIHEVQQKIDRLKRPKGFSGSSVLIHVNGVSEDLVESNYFASIVDIGMFFSDSK